MKSRDSRSDVLPTTPTAAAPGLVTDIRGESELRLRQVTEYIEEVFWLADLETDELLYVNPAFERVWGFPSSQLYQHPNAWLESVHPDDRARVAAAFVGIRDGLRCEAEYRIVRPDGEVRWIRDRGFPIRDRTGRVYRRAGIAEDVTEQRQAENALRETERRFQGFMDNGPCLAWIKDDQARYVWVNRPYEKHYGRSLDQLRGVTHFDIWPAELARVLHAHDQEVLATGRTLSTVESLPDPDGTMRHWNIFKFPFQDSDGKQYVGGIAVDMTDHKRTEAELQESARQLQKLSRRLLQVQEQERRYLARELHDEVGQTLTGLKLTLATFRRLTGTQAAECLATTEEMLRDLTCRVRDLSLRLRPSMLDDLGLVPALLWHIERYTAQTGVRVTFDHHGIGQRFPAETETAAYRIVQESLTNVARHAGVASAAVRVWAEDSTLHVTVEDSGRGFEPERVEAGRITVGLSGMRERISLLGGRLHIESFPGRGARVLAELPVGPTANGATAKGGRE